MEALPPDSRARKLVQAPRPFSAPPAMEHTTTSVPRLECGRANASTAAESATMAQQNHRNERSLEMRLVESFWVTPVMPHSTRATIEKRSHMCIRSFSSGAEQVDGNEGQPKADPLAAAQSFMQEGQRQQHGDHGKERGDGRDDRRLSARNHGLEEEDVSHAAENA